MVGEVYGVAECTISGIVKEFCKMVRLHLQTIFIQALDENRLRVLAKDFERLHNIPYIIGAIDGSHIPVLAHIIRGKIIIAASRVVTGTDEDGGPSSIHDLDEL
jgi:hypothetical protein